MSWMRIYRTENRNLSRADVIMKVGIPLRDITIYDAPLPEGYSMRKMNDAEEDLAIYDYLQTHFRRTPYIKGEKSTAILVFYGDEPVAAIRVLVTGKLGTLSAAIVLKEHRRKGICKAMCMRGLRHCEESGVTFMKWSFREWLDNFWRRMGAFSNQEGE